MLKQNQIDSFSYYSLLDGERLEHLWLPKMSMSSLNFSIWWSIYTSCNSSSTIRKTKQACSCLLWIVIWKLHSAIAMQLSRKIVLHWKFLLTTATKAQRGEPVCCQSLLQDVSQAPVYLIFLCIWQKFCTVSFTTETSITTNTIIFAMKS